MSKPIITTLKKKSFFERYAETTLKLLLILMPIMIVFAMTNAFSASTSDYDLMKSPINGTMEWFHEKVQQVINAILVNYFDKFNPSSNFLYDMLGTTRNSSSFDFFYWLGYFLLFSVFAFSLLMIAMSGFVENKNSLLELLIRLVLSVILIATCRRLFDDIALMFSGTVWAMIRDNIFNGNAQSPDSSILAEALVIATPVGTVNLLINLIFMIAFLIEFVKYILEIMERYIVVELLKISSPAVAGLVVSRTTSSITINFLKMYFSQLFLLLMNRFFSNAIVAIFSTMVTSASFSILNWFFIIAFTKAAQRIDSYMKSLGLTVAQTGSTFLDSIMGAVSLLGKGMKAVRGGAGIVGAAQMNMAAATGNYGLYKAGAAKAAFARGGIAAALTPGGDAATLKQFADAKAAGVTMSDKSRKDLVKAMTDSLMRGDYAGVARYDTKAQTEAIKNILQGEDGQAFRRATGFNASAIQSASIDAKKGIITGVVATGKDGQTATFTASTQSLKGHAGSITGADGVTRNIQVSGSVDNLDSFGSFDYEAGSGGFSNLSSMSGLQLDDERLSALGASTYHYDAGKNMLYIADDSGSVIYQRGLETGNEIFAGADKSIVGHTPDITEDDFTQIEGKLYDYSPNGIEQFTRDKSNNRIHVQTRGSGENSHGDSIFIAGTTGKITKTENNDGTTKWDFVGKNIPLNDTNTKILDSKNGGSFAVYGRNKDTKKKVSRK